jgi:hypothetical protein
MKIMALDVNLHVSFCWFSLAPHNVNFWKFLEKQIFEKYADVQKVIILHIAKHGNRAKSLFSFLFDADK